MKLSVVKIVVALTLICIPLAVCAAPGTPIGGIIVKGGKNPGGQMHVLATTDSAGKFKLKFAEGGDYRLTFEGRSNEKFSEEAKAGLQLNYLVTTTADVAHAAQRRAAESGRRTPFQNKVMNAEVIVSVPEGGGEISGELLSSGAPIRQQSSERSINESGVSVKSTPKSGVKH